MIDFHCHLDLFEEPRTVATRAASAGVRVLSVTTTPKAWRKTSGLEDATGKRYIRTALGLHPQLAHERSHELPLFEALLDETRYVGEIGLDGSPGFGQHADVQLRVFERVLAVAEERGGRIYTIHSRRAAAEVLSTLRKYQCAERCVLHWFSGTARQLSEATAMGCWFSVGPAMLRSAKGQQLVARMPRERILTETDGPFAQDKGRSLEPTDVRLAVQSLAPLWSMQEVEVDQLLLGNLKRLIAQVTDPQSGST